MATTKQPIESPVNAVITGISTAMHAWSAEQVKTIQAKVHRRLDKHADEVLMKLMGFNRDYSGGSWNIDHCNGRAGNSNISVFLKESQATAVKEWLSQIKLPEMSPKFKKNIEKEMQSSYESEVRTIVYSKTRAKANADIEELLNTVLPATLVESHLQAQEMLYPKPTS